MQHRLLVFACSLFIALSASAQVSGTVVDENQEPLIGASVKVQGTNQGTITDLDGFYHLDNVAKGATLEISYIGYLPAQVLVQGHQANAQLKSDVQDLNEVIVVGYGSAKRKDLTSPIQVVKGDDLWNTATGVSAMSGLQGKVAGVQVTNSGTPGQAPTVRIRGLGSFSNSAPLYVVDGMFYDNINFLNSTDIEEMSIMKDASAAAIYGVRAANGVVIISTKNGKRNQRAEFTYDGSVGVQAATQVLPMCSSNEYAEMLMEADGDAYRDMFTQSMLTYGGSYDAKADRFDLSSNTNWYQQLLRPAITTNHNLSVQGGTDKASYSVSGSYLYQNGVMNTENNYSRLNLRGNIDYSPFKWLTVGLNSVFANSTQRLPNNSAWQQAYNMPGIFPVYDNTTKNTYTNGFASPNTLGLTSNFYNPVATATLHDARNKSTQVLTNVYAQFNIWDNRFAIRSAFSYDYTGMQASTYIPEYYISNVQQNTTSTLYKSTTNFNNWVWDNTLTFNDQWGKHALNVMLGLSLREERYAYLSGNAQNVPGEKDSYQYISLGDTEGRIAGDDGYRYRGFSYFGRVHYGYDDRYLLMLTLRRDGSSKYNEKWGTFPSVGLGWVISNEPWMQNTKGVDYLKLRASWGMLGNDKIGASFGATTAIPERAVFGTNNALSGFVVSNNFSWLSWEVVNETNIGTSFAFLNNRLSGDIDWYYRLTQNAVCTPTVPMQNETVAGNWGEILNMGVDLSLNWEHKVNKDWTYFVGGTVGWLQNTVKNLGDDVPMIKGAKTVQKVGEKMNSYYGYRVVGIYQTEDECKNDPIAVANGLEPGDFKYEDVNQDGKIDEADKQILGSYIPDWTYGIHMGFRFRGLDLSVSFSGQAGGELWNRKRALRYACNTYNFDRNQYLNRWHGEGTSDTNPSAKALMKSWNVGDSQNASYFVEKSDYFRIQNITLGYTFTNVGAGAYKMPGIRIALTADKPFTHFTANSMTPELTDLEGWDTEVYPVTGTYTLHLQLKF